MRRVLIADDETISRNGIASIFQNHDPPWDTTAIFADGDEALEYLKTQSCIDLVVTDIRMPKFSGLDLISKIRETNTAIPIIIVSGYSEFDYAKKALDYRVFQYILKPVLSREFDGVITSVENYLQLEENLPSPNLTSEELEQFMDLLFSEAVEFGKPGAVTLLEKRCGFSFLHSYLLMIAGNASYQTTLPSFRPRINRFFQKIPCSCHVFLFRQYMYCIIVDIDTPEPSQLLGLCRELSVELGKDYEISIGISQYREGTMCTAFTQGLTALKEHFYSAGSVYQYEEKKNPPVPQKLFQTLEVQLNSKNLLDVRDGILEFMDYVSMNRPPYPLLESWLSKILSIILDFCRNHRVTGDVYSPTVSDLKFLYKYFSLDALEDDLLLLADNIFQFLDETDETNHTYLIDQVKEYLDQHYKENLSLTDLADIFQVSYTALSSLFKSITGETIIDYVTNLKINRAKELLLTTDWKIYRIAEDIGYGETKYFIKRFRQKVGVTPKEYRKIYQSL